MKMYGEAVNEADRESHKTQDYKCAEKAQQRGQQTFTLVEQDISSPETICFWIQQNILTCPAGKLRDALEAAIIMRESKIKKHAD